jgi:hypothetical protein
MLSIYRGPYTGGYDVDITGSGFIRDILCMFGDYEAIATIVSSRLLKCKVPQGHPAKVKFQLKLLDIEFDSKAFEFEMIDLIDYSVQPSYLFINGSRSITLSGDFSSIDKSSTLSCYINSSFIPAVLASSSSIECQIPVISEVSVLVVYLYIDGLNYSGSSIVDYTIYILSQYSIVSLSPNSAPSVGATDIEIFVKSIELDQSLHCKFGEFETEAIPISSTRIVCPTPRIPFFNSVDLSLMIEGIEGSNKLPISIYKDISIYKINPLSGPITGNTTVSILGNALSNVKKCRFGGIQVSVSAVSDTEVKCVSPPGVKGSVEVSLSVNLVDYSNSVEFEYYDEFVVNTVEPSMMQSTGGIWISLYGSNFVENMMCIINGFINAARYISDATIQCLTPTINISKAQYIPLSLSGNSQNNQNSTSLLALYFYPPPSVINLSRTYGYKNSILDITLTNIILSPSLTCKFSNQLGKCSYDSSILSCTIPDLPPGPSPISISINGIEFISAGSIQILSKILVSSLFPQYSLLQGNTLITISASNILNSTSISCKFEANDSFNLLFSSISLDSNYIVSGSYIDTSTLTCKAPKVVTEGWYRVYVSNNGKEWSDSYGIIRYVARCIDGFDCSSGEMKLCSKGYYCQQRMWYKSMECTEGTYQDEEGQRNCKTCPVGYYCPTRGLAYPIICPEGKVCKEPGLVYATDDCPFGFTCEAGTTTDTFLSDSNQLKPKLCTSGNYCIPSGINPCTPGYICSLGSSHHYGQSPCPPGFYCTSSGVFFCPTRHYCPGYSNTEPTPCPAGTYNSFLGQTRCSACPIGFVCPHTMMFEPQTCPPGYICDTEGLSFPQRLCVPGYYCDEGVQTAIYTRPCRVISEENILDGGYCGVDEMLVKDDGRNFSKEVPELGNGENVNLCCWSAYKVAEYFMNITQEFEDLSDTIQQNNILGLSFYIFLTSPTPPHLQAYSLPLSPSQDLLYLQKLWVYQATYAIQPKICPPKVFCLEGMTTPIPSSSIRNPSICNPGTYCKEGASTAYGTALCPQGYYCPAGVSDPIPSKPGFVTSFAGSVEATACNTGYFANSNNSAVCIECPSGYECNGQATVWPTICKNGYYRSKEKSNQCATCPIGSWSWEYGLISQTECSPCSKGRLCITAGAYNVTMSVACQEGAVCDQGISISDRAQCAAGYVCGLGTTPEESYSILCPAGFFCKEGTAKRNQYLLQCPDYMYCPDGSPDFEYYYTTNLTLQEIPATVCPIGTGRDKRNGKQTLLDCTMNTETYILEVNPFISSMIPEPNYTISTTEDFYVFYLSSREIALITIDLRHLNSIIKYGVDWEISITVSEDRIQDSETASPVEMPNIFLDSSVDKSRVHEFTLTAWKGVYFKVSVLIRNGLFLAHDGIFRDSASLEIFTPNRASYGTDQTFLAIFTSDTALPMNVPRPDHSTHLLAYAPSPGRTPLIRQPKEPNKNWYVPNTRFWQDRTSMAIPYFPYFSNCESWGAYFPIWAAVEISKECDLVTPEDTKPVQVFGFGTSPSADSCTDVKTECIYDEFYLESQPKPRWWEQPIETPLFYLTPNPISAPDFELEQDYVIEKLVPVTLKSVADSDSLPSEVMIEILYYQVDEYTKQIIESNIYFNEFTILSPEDKQSNQTIGYTLKINYRALNHRELMIRFVFPIDFYMALNVIIGMAAVILCSIIVLYHRMLTRSNPVPRFKFMSYLVLMMPAPLRGLIYAMIPISFVLVLVTVLLMSDIFTKVVEISGKDPQGEIGLFDTISASYSDFKDVPSWDSRMGRCGVSLVIIGIYLLILGANIFIPHRKSSQTLKEDPIGNVWNKTTWKRANLIFIALCLVIAHIILIQFSFSTYWGIYIWIMFAFMEVLMVVYENFGESILGDKLYLTPFLLSIEITFGLVTFGTSNYLDYVQAYYIDFVIRVANRLYTPYVIDWTVDTIKQTFEKLSPFLRTFTNLKSFTRSLRSRSVGSIVNSDLNPTEFGLTSDNPLLKSDPEPIAINVQPEVESIEQVLESYELSEVEETSSYYTIQNLPPTPPPEMPITEVIHEQDLENLLETYNGYTVELFSLLYGPFFIGILWNFYDPIQIIANYGIKREDFILYFLFSIMMLPFQLIMDVFMHNCYEYFNGWAVHDFIDYMNHKFQDRKNRWADLDNSNETAVEDKNRGLYRLCFSSQYYFICTIFTSGILITMLGLQTVLVTPSYNLFDDRGLLVISIFVFGLCVISHHGFYFLGNLLGIWKLNRILPEPQTLPESLILPEPVTTTENEQVDRLMALFDQLYRPKPISRVVPE